MPTQRHEIPTHLGVEDKALLGLSMRQVSYLLIGATGSYALANQWPDLDMSIRLSLAGAVLVVAVGLALVRPAGRGLEEWALVLLRYAAVPKLCVWAPGEPEATAWRAPEARWEELAPERFWERSEETR